MRWLLVQRKRVQFVANRDEQVLTAVEHVGLRRRGDVADVRMPERRAGRRVVGHDVAASVAREDEPAGRGQQASSTATATTAATAALGYGRRHTIFPVL